jgi:hypothetical protein
MKRIVLTLLVVAAAVIGAGSVDAKQKTIAGTWTLSVEHIGLKLVLEQKKTAVTGTLDWPHGDPIKLAGTMAGDTLTFSGDSSGENFTVHIDSTGSLQADGALIGTLKARFVDFNDAHQVVRTRDQEIPWTAMRGLHGVVHFPR